MPTSDIRDYIESRGLYILQEKDFDRALKVSVDAYYGTYPLYDLFFGEGYPRKRLERMWEFNRNMFFGNALLFADSPEINAYSIWFAPDAPEPGVWHFLTHHGLSPFASMGASAPFRIVKYDAWSTKMRLQAQAGKPAWYLFSIQCLPEMQGRHLGTKLMVPMLDYLKDNNQSMYLETHKIDNVLKYEHLGIKVVNSGAVPGTNVPFFAMMK